MKLVKRLKIWCRVIYSLLATFGGVKAHIIDGQETVKMINEGKSLVRFGDGEFGIYQGKDIHYQKWSPSLRAAFQQIKEEYENDSANSPYILAVPKGFMSISGWKLMKKRVYVSSWAESRLLFKKNFKRDIPYGDSFLFEKKNKEIYSQIWKSDSCANNVIFVHNNQEYAKAFSATYQKNTEYVQCPAKNAFEEIDRLEQEIISIVEQNGWTVKDVMMTISAGPAGKVLVYRLSKLGYHCIDAGHCWDDPLEGI